MALASEDADHSAADEEVHHDDDDGREDDGLGGGFADTLRASAGVYAKVAADAGDDEAEEDGFDQALQNVWGKERLVGDVEVL